MTPEQMRRAAARIKDLPNTARPAPNQDRYVVSALLGLAAAYEACDDSPQGRYQRTAIAMVATSLGAHAVAWLEATAEINAILRELERTG